MRKVSAGEDSMVPDQQEMVLVRVRRAVLYRTATSLHKSGGCSERRSSESNVQWINVRLKMVAVYRTDLSVKRPVRKYVVE